MVTVGYALVKPTPVPSLTLTAAAKGVQWVDVDSIQRLWRADHKAFSAAAWSSSR